MSPDKESELRRKYPLVYGREFLNGEGFRCCDGWYGILDLLGQDLTAIIAAWPEEGRAELAMCQVKEKFGTLRAYPYGGAWPPGMGEAIDRAEERSKRTCEGCGQPGTLRARGFVRTLCDECEAAREADPRRLWH
jgi:hypothetical protein